jgi:hypothetical protein
VLIVVNVAQELLGQLTDWTGCEGFKLVERDDGTFVIHVTTDLAQTLELEEKAAAALHELAIDAAVKGA